MTYQIGILSCSSKAFGVISIIYRTPLIAVIEEVIRDELFWSPFVDAEDVKVSVDDGIATLKGNVESWSEKQAAVSNAYEGGATWVRNDLSIK